MKLKSKGKYNSELIPPTLESCLAKFEIQEGGASTRVPCCQQVLKGMGDPVLLTNAVMLASHRPSTTRMGFGGYNAAPVGEILSRSMLKEPKLHTPFQL